MPTYQKCPKEVEELGNDILCNFETHTPLLDAKVKVDYVFAFGDVDPDSGEKLTDAITVRGRRVYGEARRMKLKDRAMGRGDAEICIDGDWWQCEATTAQRRALLDHELHHLELKYDKAGNLVRDDLERPVLKLREHDVEIGWFAVIAARHGDDSIERIQAKNIHDEFGQYFWPELAGAILGDSITIGSGGKTTTIPASSLGKLAKALKKSGDLK